MALRAARRSVARDVSRTPAHAFSASVRARFSHLARPRFPCLMPVHVAAKSFRSDFFVYDEKKIIKIVRFTMLFIDSTRRRAE
jgi:hypothetical protein